MKRLQSYLILALLALSFAPVALSQSSVPYVLLEDSVALGLYMAPDLELPYMVEVECQIQVHGTVVWATATEFFLNANQNIFKVDVPKKSTGLFEGENGVSGIIIVTRFMKKGKLELTEKVYYENEHYTAPKKQS